MQKLYSQRSLHKKKIHNYRSTAENKRDSSECMHHQINQSTKEQYLTDLRGGAHQLGDLRVKRKILISFCLQLAAHEFCLVEIIQFHKTSVEIIDETFEV